MRADGICMSNAARHSPAHKLSHLKKSHPLTGASVLALRWRLHEQRCNIHPPSHFVKVEILPFYMSFCACVHRWRLHEQHCSAQSRSHTVTVEVLHTHTSFCTLRLGGVSLQYTVPLSHSHSGFTVLSCVRRWRLRGRRCRTCRTTGRG